MKNVCLGVNENNAINCRYGSESTHARRYSRKQRRKKTKQGWPEGSIWNTALTTREINNKLKLEIKCFVNPWLWDLHRIESFYSWLHLLKVKCDNYLKSYLVYLEISLKGAQKCWLWCWFFLLPWKYCVPKQYSKKWCHTGMQIWEMHLYIYVSASFF